jgi:hypothetical protein
MNPFYSSMWYFLIGVVTPLVLILCLGSAAIGFAVAMYNLLKEGLNKH